MLEDHFKVSSLQVSQKSRNFSFKPVRQYFHADEKDSNFVDEVWFQFTENGVKPPDKLLVETAPFPTGLETQFIRFNIAVPASRAGLEFRQLIKLVWSKLFAASPGI